MLLSHVLTLILGSYITKLLHVKIYKETQIRVREVGSGQVGGVLSLTSVLGVYTVPQASVKDSSSLDIREHTPSLRYSAKPSLRPPSSCGSVRPAIYCQPR